MKYSKLLQIVICITALTFFPKTVIAETSVNISGNGPNVKTNVNVETNTGQNTICQNGKCTTSSPNNGSSKVCVNGECHTSEDGNLNYESEDGNTKININNNSNSTNNSTNSTSNTSVNTTANTSSDEAQEIDEDKSKIKEKLDAQKKKMNEQKQKVGENRNAIEKLIEELKNFFKNIHLF